MHNIFCKCSGCGLEVSRIDYDPKTWVCSEEQELVETTGVYGITRLKSAFKYYCGTCYIIKDILE